MSNLKKVFYVILNVIMIADVLFSLMIYTSLNQNVKWYEACGTQFLAILIISVPILLVIFVGFIILSRLGYRLTKSNLGLPIYILLGISLPIIIDGGLGYIAIYSGITVCIVAIVKIIVDIIINFKLQYEMEN